MGKVLQTQTQEVQDAVPVSQTQPVDSMDAQSELLAQQSMAALNQQMAAEGYYDENYGTPEFRSTMAQDLSGENTYGAMPDAPDAGVTTGSAIDVTTGSAIQAGDAQAASGEYNNILARLVGTIAEFVGSDTSLGSKLKSMADNLDAGSSSGEYDPENPYHDLNNDDVWNAKDAAAAAQAEAAGQDGVSDVQGEIQTDDVQADGTQADGTQIDASPLGAEGLTEQNVAFMSAKADAEVQSGEFLAAGQATDGKPFEEMRETTNSISDTLTNDTLNNIVGVDAWEENSPQKQDCSYKHMSFMRGLAAYSDQAKAGIESTYADDPASKETAMKGLEGMMGASVPQAFDTLYTNNKTFGFLTEADKAELDSMTFAGTDMKYSEYEAKRMEQDGLLPQSGYEMSADDANMYANAGLDEALDAGQDVATGTSMGVSMGVASGGMNPENVIAGAVNGAVAGIAKSKAKGNPAFGGAMGGVMMGANPVGIVSGAAKGGVKTMTHEDRVAVADQMAAGVQNQPDNENNYGMGR